ncbi:MAG: hypothetical protein AABX04_04400 [Nanoarchaeota archaeon]
MPTYHVWINCYAAKSINRETCTRQDSFCEKGCFLEFESNNPEEDLARLIKEYTLPPCPEGKARRYFASEPLENHPVNGHEILTIKDLKRKITGIEARFLGKE